MLLRCDCSSVTAALIDRCSPPIVLAAANKRSCLLHSQPAKWSRSNVRCQLAAHSTPRKFSRSIIRAMHNQQEHGTTSAAHEDESMSPTKAKTLQSRAVRNVRLSLYNRQCHSHTPQLNFDQPCHRCCSAEWYTLRSHSRHECKLRMRQSARQSWPAMTVAAAGAVDVVGKLRPGTKRLTTAARPHSPGRRPHSSKPLRRLWLGAITAISGGKGAPAPAH